MFLVYGLVYGGQLLTPKVKVCYISFLELLAKTIEKIANSHSQKIQCSKSQINEIDNINNIQNLGQFQSGVNKPPKKSIITNIQYSGCNNLDNSGLNVSPEPTIKFVGNPIKKPIHAEDSNTGENNASTTNKQNQ